MKTEEIKTWRDRITTPTTNQKKLFMSMQAEIDELRRAVRHVHRARCEGHDRQRRADHEVHRAHAGGVPDDLRAQRDPPGQQADGHEELRRLVPEEQRCAELRAHMKTANGIMALIQEYASDCNDSYYSKLTRERLVALKVVVEELHRDAAKWREYKARKDAVIAAGMGRNPLRETVTCDTYGVINEDGEVAYSAYWPEACHDHIKDMQIEHGMGSKWKVRALKYLPVTTTRKKST